MNQFNRLSKDLSNWTKIPRDLDAAQAKVKCKLKNGLRVQWYYKDDEEFCQSFDADPRKETMYSGIIVAKPDIEARGNELQLCDCVVVIESYPCEKENPRCDWCALSRLMDSDDIVELFA